MIPLSDWCGQKRPATGPEIVLPSDSSVRVNVPSTLAQRRSGSKRPPNAYDQSAAPRPSRWIVPHSSATPDGHRPAKFGFCVAVEDHPLSVIEALAAAGAIAIPAAASAIAKDLSIE